MSGIAAWGSNHRILLAILLLGLVLGLIHVVLVPPWQHYDEQSHFEYLWLVAHRTTLPQAGNHDEGMLRQVAASMFEHGFWRGSDYHPSLIVPDPNLLGPTELRHPPLYYLLAALPLRLVPYADVASQLMAARLVSVGLYLVTIVAAWVMMGDLVPAGHPLRWMVPALLALLPAYTDLMTSVNNDVAAVVVFSLFLVGAVRLVQKGLAIPRLLWTALWTAVALWTKDTIFIVIPLFALSLFLSLLRGHRSIIWAVLAGAAIISAVAVLDWGDAAQWYRYSLQTLPTRALRPEDPFHGFAFQLENGNSQRAPSVIQSIGSGSATLNGKTVTLGAWVWASAPLSGNTPTLRVRLTNQTFVKNINITTTPVFHAITATVPSDAHGLFVDLSPIAAAAVSPVTVYYSGIVLAEGERPVDQPPEFGGEQHNRGVWGGSPFENWLLNSTASGTWPWFRPWVDAIGARTIVSQPSIIIQSLFDRTIWEWYYSYTIQHLLDTFWVGVGLAHIAAPEGVVPGLVLLMLVGAIGALVALWRRRRTCPVEFVLLMAIVLAIVTFLAVVRGAPGAIAEWVFVPNSRYLYPEIIPFVIVLSVGWLEWVRPLSRWRILRPVGIIAYLSFFLFLNSYALWDMASFYRGM